MAWRIGVALGLAGGIIQVAFALIRPLQAPVLICRAKRRCLKQSEAGLSQSRKLEPKRSQWVG